jgi:predicted nucleotidyltransferase
MKLISWKGKYMGRKRDAEDLLFIMKKHEEARNSERLSEEDSPLLQEGGFDAKIAGARLLGRDIAKISDPNHSWLSKKSWMLKLGT